MKITQNILSLLVAVFGILSFIFLIAAITTDFWYRVDASKLEKLSNHTETLSSHAGLWRNCQVKGICYPLLNPFKSERRNITTSHSHVLNMRSAFVILLPLSLILLFFGGVTGLIGTFTQAHILLRFTGLLLLFGALVTLAGVSIYIAYPAAAFKEASAALAVRNRSLWEALDIQFGWSLAFAWFSFATEVLTGLTFLLMARMAMLKQQQDRII
uniref:Transmembrane protein 114 n=1 Tax=Salvator merianae TaxID=96440 RepID=A0A8D0DU49_SALMN